MSRSNMKIMVLKHGSGGGGGGFVFHKCILFIITFLSTPHGLLSGERVGLITCWL